MIILLFITPASPFLPGHLVIDIDLDLLEFVISVTASFDTPSLFKAFLNPSIPPNVVDCLPVKGGFVPKSLVAMWSDWVREG